MCLIVIAWQQHDDYPLLLAGNRDEFHARPTAALDWWQDHSDILGGRDLEAGGTWLAVHRDGRFAALTNFRDAQHEPATYRSRGYLVSEYLLGDRSPVDYLDGIGGDRYAGFNLIVGDGDSLAYLSNRGEGVRLLEPGIYGLSNALLDSDWHKVRYSKAAMRQLLDARRIEPDAMLELLADRSRARRDRIDDGRLPFEKAHAISAPFIVLPDYGTRSSSVVIRDAAGGVQFCERRFDSAGDMVGDSRFCM